jgi:DNA polymerase IIIc chi subunit
MSGTPAMLDDAWSAGWRVVIDSEGAGARESLPFDGKLAADSAVVLERP